MLPRTIETLVIPNFYGGLNLADSPSSLSITQSLKLQNLCFGESNMIEVRQGVTREANIYDTGASKGVDGIHRYSDGATNNYNIGVSKGLFATFDGERLYHTLAGTSETEIAALTAGYPSVWQEYLDMVYHGNGIDNLICYRHKAWANGAHLRETGCPAPSITANTTATIGEGDIPAGVYKFLFTLELNDGVICEGNPNTTPHIESGLSAAGKIVISINDPDPSGVYQVCNVYATKDTELYGNVYFYLTSFDLTNGNPTYSYTWDDYAALDTMTLIERNNYRPPAGYVHKLYNNHLFIGGVAAHPNYVYISKFGRIESFPGNVAGGDPVSSAYIIDCEDKVMGMALASNGGLLILCENSVQLITGYSVDTFSRVIISSGTSCAARLSIAAGNDGRVFWMGRDDIYASDGNRIYRIGRYIWPELRELNSANHAKIVGFFYDQKYNICYASTAGTSVCNRRLEFDTRYADMNLGTLGAWTGPHKMGGDTSPISISCFSKSRNESETKGYFGSGNTPVIYRYDYGKDDDGMVIEAILWTGVMYVGAPLLTKRYHCVACESRPTGAQPTITIEIDNGDIVLPAINIAPIQDTAKWLGEGDSPPPRWQPESGPYSYPETDYIKWAGESYEYFKGGLGQEAMGDCVQIKLYCLCKSRGGISDNRFALRNLGLMYTVIRRFWR